MVCNRLYWITAQNVRLSRSSSLRASQRDSREDAEASAAERSARRDGANTGASGRLRLASGAAAAAVADGDAAVRAHSETRAVLAAARGQRGATIAPDATCSTVSSRARPRANALAFRNAGVLPACAGVLRLGGMLEPKGYTSVVPSPVLLTSCR